MSASLDLLNEAVSKFGGLVASEHARIRDALLPELDESRAGVRKRAIHCLSAPWHSAVRARMCSRAASRPERAPCAGALAPHLSDALLDGVVKHLLERLKAPDNRPEAARTYMHSVAAIRRGIPALASCPGPCGPRELPHAWLRMFGYAPRPACLAWVPAWGA